MEAPGELPTPPAGVCGYEWPRDCDRVQLATDRPIRQSCCFRPTVADADRCRWHAPPEAIPENSTAALAAASVSSTIRAQTDSVVQLLDGASLRGCTLGEQVSLTATALSGADLREADLSGADLTDAFLWGADLTDADLTGTILTDADFEDADLTGTDLDQAILWASQ